MNSLQQFPFVRLDAFENHYISSAQFSCSVVSNSLWPHGLQHARFTVHHQLPEFAQTHIHRVSDAIQPSHPLSSLSPPTFNLSQHQGLFQGQFFASGGQNIGVSASASVLPMNTQDWSSLRLTSLISLQSKGHSTVLSNTTVQFKSISSSALYSPTLTSIHDYWKKTYFWLDGTFLAK